MAASVAEAQAAVQLEAANAAAAASPAVHAAAISRGSSPVNFGMSRYGAAEDMMLSLPPYVIMMPRDPATSMPLPDQPTGQLSQGIAPPGSSLHTSPDNAVRRDAFLPPPGLVASAPAGDGGRLGLRPRLAPWELERQLQESLRK